MKRAIYPMPADVRAALGAARVLGDYLARPMYQQNDYVGWITRAKRDETRARRVAQMLAELSAGDRYMKMAYRAKARP